MMKSLTFFVILILCFTAICQQTKYPLGHRPPTPEEQAYLDAHVVEIMNEGGWNLKENLLYEGDAGTVPLSGANIYPGVISRSFAYGSGVENFVIFRNFVSGSTEQPAPFPLRFGELQFMGILSDGNKWEPPY